MTFRTDNANASQLAHSLLLRRALRLILFEKLLERLSGFQKVRIVALNEAGRKCDLLLVILQIFHSPAGLELRISAQDDIGTTTCHVGRDRMAPSRPASATI